MPEIERNSALAVRVVPSAMKFKGHVPTESEPKSPDRMEHSHDLNNC